MSQSYVSATFYRVLKYFPYSGRISCFAHCTVVSRQVGFLVADRCCLLLFRFGKVCYVGSYFMTNGI